MALVGSLLPCKILESTFLRSTLCIYGVDTSGIDISGADISGGQIISGVDISGELADLEANCRTALLTSSTFARLEEKVHNLS